MKRIILAVVMVALLSITMIGCHTVRGAGKDIQSGGRALERAAGGAGK